MIMGYLHKIGLVLLTSLCLGSISVECRAEELRDPALDRLLEKVEADYGIDLHYAEGPAPKFTDLVYSLADVKDKPVLEKAILLFIQEISLYPRNFFRYAHCRDIYFVRRLFYKKKPVEGVFSAGANYIFYDYSRRGDNTQKIRHYIHHELYHAIGSKHPFWRERGPAWEALNRKEFSYSQKYDPHKRNPINYYAPPELGFITDYAMASAEEDRAEVFACMMIPEQFSLMEQWAQKDRILFDKVEMMKEFLKEAF
jgi:hypothetical protein